MWNGVWVQVEIVAFAEESRVWLRVSWKFHDEPAVGAGPRVQLASEYYVPQYPIFFDFWIDIIHIDGYMWYVLSYSCWIIFVLVDSISFNSI